MLISKVNWTLPSPSKRLNNFGKSFDTRIYPCCTSIRPYDDNVEIICVTGLREIFERCENSRCVPKNKSPSRLSSKNDNASNCFSSLMPMMLATKRRHYCTPWESETTLVESKKLFLDLGGLAPEIVNLNILQILLS